MCTIAGVFAVVGVLVAMWSIYTLRRNDALSAYRLDMIDWVFSVHGAAMEERRAEYYSVSRAAMLYKFWRSFDSFYPRYAVDRRARRFGRGGA